MSNFLIAHKMPYQSLLTTVPVDPLVFKKHLSDSQSLFVLQKYFILIFSGIDRESSYKSQAQNLLKRFKFNNKSISRYYYTLLGIIIDL